MTIAVKQMHQDKRQSNNTIQRSIVKSKYILFWISVQSFSFVFFALHGEKFFYLNKKSPHDLAKKTYD